MGLETDSSVLVWMPLAVIALMLMRGVTSFVSSYCISLVSGMVMQTRRRLFGHMMRMPVAFFDQQSTGTLLSRITYDSEQVALLFQRPVTVVREGASIIGLFIMMFYYSWQLSVILIAGTDRLHRHSPGVQAFPQHQQEHAEHHGAGDHHAEQMLKGHKKC